MLHWSCRVFPARARLNSAPQTLGMSNNTRPHAHDLGLGHDLLTLRNRSVSRRTLLRWGAGASLLTLAGCPSDGVAVIGGTAAAEDNTAAGSCSTIPEETAGPYPGDGSNGVNALVR